MVLSAIVARKWSVQLRWQSLSRGEAAAQPAALLALCHVCRFVGVSRITDYKHHPSDVAAGALLGAMFAVLYAVRAVGRLPSVVDVVASSAPAAADGSPLGTPQADTTLLRGGRVHAAAELV
jgi:phosphatidate phosphatase